MLKNNDEFYIHCGVENLRTPLDLYIRRQTVGANCVRPKKIKPRRGLSQIARLKKPTVNQRTNLHKPRRKRQDLLRAARGRAAKPTAQARTV